MQNLLDIAIFTSIQAGQEIMKFYNTDLDVRHKSYKNPVTDADIAADKKIHEILTNAYPDFGWLSEETKDSPGRLGKKFVWVVDPLDGTKEFIEGVPHFVVSIGLVRKGDPVIGVLYNPVTEELFHAEKDMGAYLNGKKIHCSVQQDENLVDIVVSRSELKAGLWEDYIPRFKKIIEIGSVAYKLGLVASGKYDFFATLKPKNEWDICAGQIILTEAGGTLKNIGNFTPPIFNQISTLQTPGLVGGNLKLSQKFYNSWQENSVTY